VSQEKTELGEDAFEIATGTSGTVLVRTRGGGSSPKLNFEKKAQYSLTVRMTDTAGLSDDAGAHSNSIAFPSGNLGR
jgi:hypothetical protein